MSNDLLLHELILVLISFGEKNVDNHTVIGLSKSSLLSKEDLSFHCCVIHEKQWGGHDEVGPDSSKFMSHCPAHTWWHTSHHTLSQTDEDWIGFITVRTKGGPCNLFQYWS